MASWSNVFSRILLRHVLLSATCVCLIFSFMGCQRDEPVVKHRVSKSRSGLEALQGDSTLASSATSSEMHSQTQGAADATEGAADRMVVAIFSTENATWFFKITGAAERVAENESQWRPFLESVTFSDDQPKWELPQEWSAGEKRPMRFATLTLDDLTPPLEMAISSLSPDQDLLLNVNRWRGQMGLGPIEESKLGDDTQSLNSETENAVLFDVTGKSAGGMRAPFAGGAAPFAGRAAPFAGAMPNSGAMAGPGAPPGTGGSSPQESGVEFEAPEGWEPGRTSSMVPVRLQKTAGEKSAQISIIPLPAAANTWELNAERWAGQLQMVGLSAEEMKALTSAIQVDGIDGQMIKLIPEGDAAQTATIAAMVKQNQTAWFFKLTGDKQIVRDHEEEFLEFLKTLQLP